MSICNPSQYWTVAILVYSWLPVLTLCGHLVWTKYYYGHDTEHEFWDSYTLKSMLGPHSVSKETLHEFIGFPCDPGSRSSDPGRIIFDHGNLSIGEMKYSTKFIYPHSSPKETHLCVSFETEYTF